MSLAEAVKLIADKVAKGGGKKKASRKKAAPKKAAKKKAPRKKKSRGVSMA